MDITNSYIPATNIDLSHPQNALQSFQGQSTWPNPYTPTTYTYHVCTCPTPLSADEELLLNAIRRSETIRHKVLKTALEAVLAEIAKPKTK